MVKRLGEKGTFCIIIKKVKKPQGVRGGVRKSRIKGERKFDRDQSSEYLRHGNSCILRRNTSSVSWVILSRKSILSLLLVVDTTSYIRKIISNCLLHS